MNYALYISAISAIIAACAFVLSFLNYRTSRHLPNENKIFEEKIKTYQTIIAALNNSAAVFIDCAKKFHELKRSPGSHRNAEDQLNDELDKSYLLLEDTVHEQALLLPDLIVDLIYNYFELLDDEDFLDDHLEAANLDKFEAELNNRYDKIVDAMRADIAFEKLDTGLKKRTGGRHRGAKKVLIGSN